MASKLEQLRQELERDTKLAEAEKPERLRLEKFGSVEAEEKKLEPKEPELEM